MNQQQNEAGILFQVPRSKPDQDKSNSLNIPRRSDPVFYNPRQALNRDISVLALQAWAHLQFPVKNLLEAFAGTGIRALRYALQGPSFQTIFVNDVSTQAIQLCQTNFAPYLHEIKNRGTKINFSINHCSSFFKHASINQQQFDIIDIDPFGTPQPFIRSAVELLGNPGLLAVTATDMPVITGLYPNKAYKLYQISNFKVANRSYCHEVGLRMFIAYIQREGMSASPPCILMPLLSYYADHYIRLFFRRIRGGEFSKIYQSHGYILDCQHCGVRRKIHLANHMENLTSCLNCSSYVHPLGPLYLGQLHETIFLETMVHLAGQQINTGLFDRTSRLFRFLELFLQDLIVDQVWFYNLDWVARRYKVSLPSTQKVVDLLKKYGHQASLTHFNGRGIRTDISLDNELPKYYSVP